MASWSLTQTDETSGEDCAPWPRKNPRKGTYYARKDEIESLHEQVQSLEASLQELSGDRGAEVEAQMAQSVALNMLLGKGILQQQLQLAGAQSLLSSYNTSFGNQTDQAPQWSIPLKTHILLPSDATQRSVLLESMREDKLLSAFQFMAARTRFHDLRVAHHSCEQSRLLNGDLIATVFSIVQFDKGHSLRQVFEAYDFFATNQEISVSDNLGVLTICESDPNGIGDVGGQMRFVSTPLPGLEVDSNLVRFTTCVDPMEHTAGYAIGTLDFVDQDDLYPYMPHRARKETTSAWLMVEVPSPTGSRVIAMARWSHSRFHPPNGPLSKEMEAAATSSMLHWCDLMPLTMVERLATQAPAP